MQNHGNNQLYFIKMNLWLVSDAANVEQSLTRSLPVERTEVWRNQTNLNCYFDIY